MSKKKNVRNVDNQNQYKNPEETLWGKIVLWILVIGFAGLIVFGAIAAIINNFT